MLGSYDFSTKNKGGQPPEVFLTRRSGYPIFWRDDQAP
jgi:hypothetical protein